MALGQTSSLHHSDIKRAKRDVFTKQVTKKKNLFRASFTKKMVEMRAVVFIEFVAGPILCAYQYQHLIY